MVSEKMKKLNAKVNTNNTNNSDRDKTIYVTDRGNLNCGYQVLLISPDELFTITEEVEITEETILEEMVIVRTIEYKNGNVQKIITLATHKSINDVKGEEDWNKKSILHEVWTVKGNGMGELIWSKERGLVD